MNLPPDTPHDFSTDDYSDALDHREHTEPDREDDGRWVGVVFIGVCAGIVAAFAILMKVILL